MTDSKTYGIIGLGLLGASFAKAVREAHPEVRLVAVDTQDAVCATAVAQGVVDEAHSEAGAFLRQCDVIMVCTPLAAYRDVFAAIGEFIDPSAILTDVGGSKVCVEQWVAMDLPDTRFVGGHPMAGGQLGGYRRGRADLFSGARVALCPPAGAEEDAETLRGLWLSLGAAPVVVPADEHDRIVASTSHLPYLSAVAQSLEIVELITHGIAGRGLSNAMRHAGFAPQIMASVAANNAHVPSVVRAFAKRLEQLADLAESDPEGLSSIAADARNALRRFDD